VEIRTNSIVSLRATAKQLGLPRTSILEPGGIFVVLSSGDEATLFSTGAN